MDAPLLICAAVEEELAGLLPALRRAGPTWTGRVGEVDAAARAIGIGPVEAALGATEALRPAPAAAIFLGTCGVFPGAAPAIGSVVVVDRAVLASAEAAAGLAYQPERMERFAQGDVRVAAALAGADLPRAGAATVVAITRDGGRAIRLREATGCEVEHLEAYAFLLAAARAGVPAACLLGVANEVGPDAHAQWRANCDAAARAAAALLERRARLALAAVG